ncbi:MAG: hypothetical protein DRH89_01435 [Candidatus Cloacimonadota bacterium]|nr:MAG: hypothetical protein DRH89_01435 [Candidatus Cloacimonadota bacterium]
MREENTKYINEIEKLKLKIAELEEENELLKSIKTEELDKRQITAHLFNIGTPLCLVSTNYKIIQVNDSFCSTFGIERKDAVNKTCHHIWNGSLCNTEDCILSMLTSGKNEVSVEAFREIADGSSHPFLIQAKPFLDSNGKIIGVVASFVDITERKIAENALKESNEKFRILTDTIPSAVMMNQNNKWVYTNSAGCEISGYSEAELLKMNYWEFVHPDYVEFVRGIGEKRQEGKNTDLRYEFVIITKNGEEKWVDLVGGVSHYNGKPAGIISVSDISHRKKIEKELKESEERFKFLSKATFEGIVVHKRGIILDANDSFLKMTGYTRDEAIGKNLLNYIPKKNDIAKVIKKMLQKHAKPYVISAQRKDGTIFMLELEGRNLKYNGEKVRIVALRNVTDRIKAETALKESEERFKYLFNSTPISIWEEDFSEVYDYIQLLKEKGIKDFNKYFDDNPDDVKLCSEKAKILDVNNTTLSMFNAKSKSEILNSLAAIFTKDSLNLFKGQLIKIANNETYYSGKCKNKTLDGRILDVLVHWAVVPGYEKDYSRILVSLIDITSHEKAQRSLIESEENFRQLAENIDQVFWLTDWKNKKQLYVSPAFEKVFELSTESAYNNRMNWTSVIHSEDKSRVEEIFKMSGLEKCFVQADYRIITKSGKLKWIDDRSYPIFDENGELDRFVSIAEDITIRKDNEEKVKSLLEEKEILLREVHHRIKNNMATIESLLRLHTRNTKNTEVISGLNDAVNRIKSMRILYDKLLGSDNFNDISILGYLSPLIDEVISVFPNKNIIKINKQIEDFEINAKLVFPLGIIINELITNIMKYAFKDTVDNEITIIASKKNDKAWIAIQDNGIGISEEINLKTTNSFGLRLVEMLIRQINGSIELIHENGTKFILEFDL